MKSVIHFGGGWAQNSTNGIVSDLNLTGLIMYAHVLRGAHFEQHQRNINMLIFVQLLVLSCDCAVLHMLYCAPPGPPDFSATRYESVGTSFEFTRDKNRMPETKGDTSAFALVSYALEIPRFSYPGYWVPGIPEIHPFPNAEYRVAGMLNKSCTIFFTQRWDNPTRRHSLSRASKQNEMVKRSLLFADSLELGRFHKTNIFASWAPT